MCKFLELKKVEPSKVHLKRESEADFIAVMGDYSQGEDATFEVEVRSSSSITASVSCRGCLKARTEKIGEERYKVTVKYDTTFLGRIIKKVWIKNKEEIQITMNLRGFVEK